MGFQVVKQPDDRLAIVSSESGRIVCWDATDAEIVDWFVERAVNRAREDARRVVDAVAADEANRIYAQCAMTWDEALEDDRNHGGDAWQDFEAKPDADQR